MKYKWKIKITTNSGLTFSGEYECEHNNSTAVGIELLKENCTFNTIKSDNKNNPSQLFFRIKDVSVMEISPL